MAVVFAEFAYPATGKGFSVGKYFELALFNVQFLGFEGVANGAGKVKGFDLFRKWAIEVKAA